VGRALPVASGTTIRTPPEQATLFLSTVGSSAFDRKPAEASLLRSDSSGNASTLHKTKREILSALDVTADARFLMAAGFTPETGTLNVTIAPTAGGPSSSTQVGPQASEPPPPSFDSLKAVLQP
jgi:hypothetical protein